MINKLIANIKKTNAPIVVGLDPMLNYVPEHVQKLLSFLKRRHGYSLIEFGKLDEAEKVFKSLLDDPTSQDYAVSELAYIQKLKANESPES